MLSTGSYLQGLRRIMNVGTLEEAQQIADALLSYVDPHKATVACKECGKDIEWDTAHRFVNDLNKSEKEILLCFECCPQCKSV
jgi:hypothetical protein